MHVMVETRHTGIHSMVKVICTIGLKVSFCLRKMDSWFRIQRNSFVLCAWVAWVPLRLHIRRDVILPFTCPNNDYPFHLERNHFFALYLVNGHPHKFLDYGNCEVDEERRRERNSHQKKLFPSSSTCPIRVNETFISNCPLSSSRNRNNLISYAKHRSNNRWRCCVGFITIWLYCCLLPVCKASSKTHIAIMPNTRRSSSLKTNIYIWRLHTNNEWWFNIARDIWIWIGEINRRKKDNLR